MTAMLLPLSVLVLVIVFLFYYGVFRLVSPERTASDRLSDLSSPEVEDLDVQLVLEENDDQTLVSRLSKLANPPTEEERKAMRLLLAQAGYKNRNALGVFGSVRATAAVCLPLIASPIIGSLDSILYMSGGVLVAVVIGFYAPYLMLVNTVEKRKSDILKSFPDCLDLMVSCVEAGLGLDAAIRRVASELEFSAPELSNEFRLVTHEIAAGVPRIEALRHLQDRTGIDEIRSLVNMLAQAERFGTSVANSLRVYSKVARDKRMSRAETVAAQVSPKLTVVMILFFLPCLFCMLLGPAAINAMYTFSP